MAVMQSRMNMTTAITPTRRKEKKVMRKDRQIVGQEQNKEEMTTSHNGKVYRKA